MTDNENQYFQTEEIEVIVKYTIKYKKDSPQAREDVIGSVLRDLPIALNGVGKGGCYDAERGKARVLD